MRADDNAAQPLPRPGCQRALAKALCHGTGKKRCHLTHLFRTRTPLLSEQRMQFDQEQLNRLLMNGQLAMTNSKASGSPADNCHNGRVTTTVSAQSLAGKACALGLDNPLYAQHITPASLAAQAGAG